MASSSSNENSTAYNLLSRILSSKPSRLHGSLGGIYAGMCQELEPQRDNGLPSEAWNASVDPRPQSPRYRSDNDSSFVSTKSTPTRSPTFDIPRWTWPATEVPHVATARISECIKPVSTA